MNIQLPCKYLFRGLCHAQRESEKKTTVKIGSGIYWVGSKNQENGLHCNPYLLIDGPDAVLFDPGSPLDFVAVFTKVSELISISALKYIVLNHQDPDICAGLPLWERKGLKAQLVCHWRTSLIVRYYGVNSPFYLVDQNKFQLKLSDKRSLYFIHTPYLNFPGAIASYDSTTKILFSGDLFGAFSQNWKLVAADEYLEQMKTFHEHYMPGNDIIRPVMEKLLHLPIVKIAPQHGSIIIN